MSLVAGIDEAGRGPIVGSLFIAGALFEEGDEGRLRSLGVKDSKLLTHKKRVQIEKQILKIAKNYKIVEIKPAEIDHAVGGHDGLNLNWLEARKTAEIINFLNPDKAIVDCPSPNIKAYANYLRKFINNQNMELILDHKAEKYEPVAAASILAKVAREEEVEKIEKKIGQKIGTGYMSNPQCQKFVKENFDKYPKLFRKSWMPYKKQVEEKEQKKIDEY
ncbi:ribonuclease HII [Candidatus Woesearchaeota archaeon]|nr:ribonuclease HII [Candidatus Woesearchaeota archaeon]